METYYENGEFPSYEDFLIYITGTNDINGINVDHIHSDCGVILSRSAHCPEGDGSNLGTTLHHN